MTTRKSALSRRAAPAAFAFVLAAVLTSSPRVAAQVHWDAGLSAGAVQRIAIGGGPGAPSPAIGPVAELHAHVAVLPMIRAGAYLAHDISPMSGRPARQITEAGVRLKLTPPLVRSPWHLWSFIGLGYARSYAPSYFAAGSAEPSSGLRVSGAGGGILDMPLGLGASVKVHGPWALFAELAGRIGWLFSGSMYRPPECCAAAYVGKDSFAAQLTVGVSLEQ